MKHAVHAAYSVVQDFFLRRFRHRHAIAVMDRITAPLLAPAEIATLIERAEALRRTRAHGREVFLRHPGDARSAFVGRGLDFEEVRAYEAGDDIRDMDWRTTARTGKPYLKVFREEHHPALHVMIDRGATMRFGTVRQLKAAQAAAVAIVAAVLESSSHACVGGSVIEDAARTLPCLPRQAGIMALAEAATQACPPGVGSAAQTHDAWHAALKRSAAMLPRGARVLLIGDFHWLDLSALPLLAHLADLHDVAAVSVLDAAERELPRVGRVTLFDLSTARALRVNTGDAAVRRHFAAAAAQRRAAVHALLARAGISDFLLAADADPLTLFFGGELA